MRWINFVVPMPLFSVSNRDFASYLLNDKYHHSSANSVSRLHILLVGSIGDSAISGSILSILGQFRELQFRLLRHDSHIISGHFESLQIIFRVMFPVISGHFGSFRVIPGHVLGHIKSFWVIPGHLSDHIRSF